MKLPDGEKHKLVAPASTC